MAGFPPLPDGTRTNYRAPWALVFRGGIADGKRPSTRLAFITSAGSLDGGKTLTMRCIMPNSRGEWTKPRPLHEVDVVKSWRHKPSAASITTERKRLAKIGATS